MSENSSNTQTDQLSFFPPIKLLDALLVLSSFLISFLLAFLLYFIKKSLGIDSISKSLGISYYTLEVLAQYFIAGFVILAVYLFVIRKYKLDLTSFGFRRLPILKTVAYVVLAFIATFVSWIVLIPFIMIFFPTVDISESQNIFQMSMGPVAQVLLVIYAVIIGPFIEEVVFRGVVFPAVSRRFNIYAGIIVNTLIWSLLHFQINVIIFTLIFGVILSYLYLKTQSIWPSYLTHVCKNLMAVIAIYVMWAMGLSV